MNQDGNFPETPSKSETPFSIVSEAPAPAAARNVSYPDIAETRLANGLRVLVLSDWRLPRVTVRVGLPSGRVESPSKNLALPALVLDLTQEGTNTRDTRLIAREFDQFAIQLQSEVLMEYSLMAMNVLDYHLDKALDLLSDILIRPTFPESELDRIKVRWRSSLISQRSEPGFLARERTFHTWYKDHPYSRVSIPIPHLDSTTRPDVQSFYRSVYTARDSLLLFSGPIELDRAVELSEQYFGSWQSSAPPQADYPQVKHSSGRLVRLVHRPNSVQTRIVVSGRIPPRPDPELLRFRMANQIFGGGASSRLFLNLREDKGLTYGAYSLIRSYRRDGLFLASADVNAAQTQAAIQEILLEIERMGTGAPSKDELERSRAEIIGSFLRQMETSSLIGYLELHRRLNDLPQNYYTTFIPTINSIGPDEVLRVSQSFFDPGNIVLTVVGDRTQVEKEVSGYGDLEVFDHDGRRV